MQPLQQMQQRPLGITLLSTLALLDAALAVFQVFASMAPESVGPFGQVNVAGGLGVQTVAYLVVAGVYLQLSYGLWDMKRWAWYLALVISVVHVVVNVLIALSGNATWALAAIGSIIPVVIVVYLATPGVRRAFKV
jgi:uncharacterized membrane protein (DUF2068 family)